MSNNFIQKFTTFMSQVFNFLTLKQIYGVFCTVLIKVVTNTTALRKWRT